MVEQLADTHLEVRLDRLADDSREVALRCSGGDWERRVAALC